MKATLTQATLIMVISVMASLNVFAQKRFDNHKQNRKIVVTKTGPKSTITENWIPMDSLSSEQKQEIFEALVEDSKTPANPRTDFQPTYSGYRPVSKSHAWDLTMFGSKIFDI